MPFNIVIFLPSDALQSAVAVEIYVPVCVRRRLALCQNGEIRTRSPPTGASSRA